MYQRKVLIKILSDHEGQGQLKYDDNTYAKFGRNDYLNQNVATVHEENKQFKCDICNTNFRQKGNLDQHVATVHEGKKPFKCEICDINFGRKYHLNRHAATAHKGKKEF